MALTVVHVRKSQFKQGDPGCVYGGRNFAEFQDEGWSNPYHEGPDGNREQVIEKYQAMLRRSPRLLYRIHTELRGQDKKIGCWCSPLPCHCNVIAQIANSCQFTVWRWDDSPRYLLVFAPEHGALVKYLAERFGWAGWAMTQENWPREEIAFQALVTDQKAEVVWLTK